MLAAVDCTGSRELSRADKASSCGETPTMRAKTPSLNLSRHLPKLHGVVDERELAAIALTVATFFDTRERRKQVGSLKLNQEFVDWLFVCRLKRT